MMTSYQIKELKLDDFYKCSNIWAMDKKPTMANKFYDELIRGERITFIYVANNEFIGEDEYGEYVKLLKKLY